jgi:hypothetical protein
MILTKKNILDFFIYFIAYYYVLASAVNDGFTHFFLGVPFLIFLIYDFASQKGIIKYLHLSVFTIFLILLLGDKSKNHFIYPIIGKKITFKKDIKYKIKNGCLEFSTDSNKSLKNKTVKFISQKVSSYADISTNYIYEIEFENKKLLLKENDLIWFFKLEKLKYPRAVPNTAVFYFSFYLLVYPVVLFIFLFLVSLKRK